MSSDNYAAIADLYDVYVNTQFDIPYWLDLASGSILDLMCGTGRVTLPLIDAGHDVTAIDNSPELLDILRQKLTHPATIIQADVCDFDLERQFDLVILPFNAFAEIVDEADQRRALQAIRRHTNGRFVCTLHNPAVRLKTVDNHLRLVASYPQADGNLLFWIHQRYDEATQRVNVTQFYEEYDAQSIMVRKRMMQMAFSLIEREAFAEMASQAGFEVVALYGDYAHNPYHAETSPFMIWHLR
jgi:SAM-dependent methyltransferase